MEKARLIPIENGWGHPFEELNYYKVYHDGGHYVGTRLMRSKSKRPPKKPVDTDMDIAFDSLYLQALRQGFKNEAMADYIQAGLEKLYPASSKLWKYILEKIDKKQSSFT